MTDAELTDAVQRARDIAGKAGPMHALWDAIADADAILKGRRSLLPRPDIERILTRATAGPAVME